MPAPPPLSEPAIVKAVATICRSSQSCAERTGGTRSAQRSVPYAGIIRIRFDGLAHRLSARASRAPQRSYPRGNSGAGRSQGGKAGQDMSQTGRTPPAPGVRMGLGQSLGDAPMSYAANIDQFAPIARFALNVAL